jgi:hypothetical protein
MVFFLGGAGETMIILRIDEFMLGFERCIFRYKQRALSDWLTDWTAEGSEFESR